MIESEQLAINVIARYLELRAKENPNFPIHNYRPGMEVQILGHVKGEVVKTTGTVEGALYNVYPVRIPKDADTSPHYVPGPLAWDIDAHAFAIGCTGWNFQEQCSEWVAFDFDLATDTEHVASGVSDDELAAIRDKVQTLSYAELHRSKSGNGLHLRVYLDNVATANHTEHAELARHVLGIVEREIGHPLKKSADVIGGNFWLWHRDTSPNGFEPIVKPTGGTLDVGEWRATPVDRPDIPSVALDDDHRKLIGWLTSEGYVADFNDGRLTTHTAALKAAHGALTLRGEFDTLATGKDRKDQNCFAYPQAKGAWRVVRFGKGTTEAETWQTSQNGWTICDFNKSPGRKAKADEAGIIVNLATAADELFHTHDGQAYVVTVKNDRPETLLVAEESYRDTLRLRFTEKTKAVAKRDWINNAVDQLEAIARTTGEPCDVALRVAEHGGRVYIDLANDRRSIVEVSSDGWRVVESSPVRFRRPAGMLPLPIPVTGGSLDSLRPLVNVTDDDWPLFAGGLVMGFHPRGPYPIIALVGSGGCAKTTLSRLIQDLVDPSVATGSAEAESTEDLMVVAQHRWMIGFDNLSNIDQRLSDALCRLATGGAYSRRKKYSDADQTTFKAKRPVVLTSIEDVAKAPDLLDRALRFELPRISARVGEQELQQRFEAIRPAVLGVLLDGVASALRNLPTVDIGNPPRMADFAFWATAAEQGLGLRVGSVMESYRRNRSDVTGLILEDDLARRVINLKGFHDSCSALAPLVGWETNSTALRKLSGELRRLAPALESAGVAVDFSRSNGKRLVTISGA